MTVFLRRANAHSGVNAEGDSIPDLAPRGTTTPTLLEIIKKFNKAFDALLRGLDQKRAALAYAWRSVAGILPASWLLLTGALWFPYVNPASAQYVVGTFSGSISGFEGWQESLPAGLEVGDAVTGTLTFDADHLWDSQQVSPNIRAYWFPPGGLTFSVSIPPYQWVVRSQSAYQTIQVVNEWPGTGDIVWWSAAGSPGDSGPNLGDRPADVDLFLFDIQPPYDLNDDQFRLPVQFGPGDFAGRVAEGSIASYDSDGAPWWQINFVLDALTLESTVLTRSTTWGAIKAGSIDGRP